MLQTMAHKCGSLCRLVKIEHSVFALPFAYLGAFWAARGWPGWKIFLLLTLAMVAVRSFAMTVNRLADLRFDRANPRTADRPLVTGQVGLVEASIFAVLSGAIFVAAAAGLNDLCLALSPVALFLSAFYSFTKRFTWLCHFLLGLVLGLAPVAGWIAVDPHITLPAVLLLLAVTFWVAGFDILYACQDAEFDRKHGLQSLPARLGVPTALVISSFCHMNTALFLFLAGWAAGAGALYHLIVTAVCLILYYEHRLVTADDLSRLDTAFFTFNGVVSVALFFGALGGLPTA